jgi:tetratricopeptide (TPR) repeat protein
MAKQILTIFKKNTQIFSLKNIFLLLMILFLQASTLQAESAGEKAVFHRNLLIEHLRKLRLMVYNFPCDPFPECLPSDPEERIKNPGIHVGLYRKAKRIYQEGIVYLYEKNYVNAYSRFLEAEAVIDKLLESLSQQYIDRAELMFREAIEKKNPNDPNDMSLVDISMDFGPNSKLRRDFDKAREIPLDPRRYDPRNFHWAINKYKIEQASQKGYEFLGLAKQARQKAVELEREANKTQKIAPDVLVKRINLYMKAIEHAKQTKLNAEFVFALKYPYDNYPLFNQFGKTEKIDDKPGEIPSLHGVKMNWSKNPYVYPKNLHPIFDFRTPEKWHVDTVDARNMRFDDEFDVMIKFRYYKNKKPPVEILEDKSPPKPKNPLPDT